MTFEITLIANPENRRASMFEAAVAQRGGVCRVLSWLDVLEGRARIEAGSKVRIESYGENWDVESRLLGCSAPENRGQVRGLEVAFLRFSEVLESFPQATYMTPPGQILAMFDKVESKRRMAAAGLSVPKTYGLVRDFDGLAACLRDVGRRRAFVKPRHGSSASGVIALTMTDARVTATSSVELEGGQLYNSLKLRRYNAHDELRRVVDLLGREDELIVEEWVPKGTTEGGIYDVRVVAIAAATEHAVVRVSKGPMTNLHLGNARGDLQVLKTALGDAWQQVEATARRALAAFPRALYAGVDIGVTQDRSRVTPFEINAFGDLVPGILDASGRDTYLAEVDAFMDTRT